MLKSVFSQMPLVGWILLALAGIVLFGFSMFEIGQKQHKEHPTHTGNYANHRADESNQQDAGNRADEDQRDDGGFFNLAEKYSGVFLVIVTAILVIVTGFLWQATRNLVRGAEETAERQLRAYVSVSSAEVRKFGTAQPLEARVVVRNSGQTPAYKLRNQIAIAAAKFPVKKFPDYPEWKSTSSGFLGPGEIIQSWINAPRALTTEEQAKVVSGEVAIYVSFEVRYWDTFGKKEHFAQFRGFYRGDGVAPGAGTVLELTQTEEANEGD
jgi:hypothetical protein